MQTQLILGFNDQKFLFIFRYNYHRNLNIYFAMMITSFDFDVLKKDSYLKDPTTYRPCPGSLFDGTRNLCIGDYIDESQ